MSKSALWIACFASIALMMGCGHDSRKTGSAQCGNSIVEEGETCDDGNADELDGCSSVCATEEGWECPPAGGACQRQ